VKIVREVAYESIDPDRVQPIPQVGTVDPLIYQIGLSLKADIAARYPTGKIFGESAATMLAARLLQQHSVRTPKLASDEDGLSSYTLRQVLNYIRSHLSQDLSIIDLAQVAGMSPYYFLRLFKQSMHITPRQYIIQIRIDRAQELLQLRELSKLARRLLLRQTLRERRSLISRFSVGLVARVILLTYFVRSPRQHPKSINETLGKTLNIYRSRVIYVCYTILDFGFWILDFGFWIEKALLSAESANLSVALIF
jgi:AraC-like DNA-binding protein